MTTVGNVRINQSLSHIAAGYVEVEQKDIKKPRLTVIFVERGST